jgi:hypothetical protein
MNSKVYKLLLFLFLNAVLISELPAQQEESDNSAYDSKFFDQLRAVFGRFRNADLQSAFREAQQIHCSELVGRKGEWRPVAFFNEDRSLGDWYRESIEQVKADLTVYTFKGTCDEDDGAVQVTSEFPTQEGLAAYKNGRLDLEQVDITLNDPVKANINPQTKAYTFQLPYLFLKSSGPRKLYSFMAPDRQAAYAPDVSSRWECKAVSTQDLTYRFIICRVSTVPQRLHRNETWEPTFGSSAFFILSDGIEEHTTVHMKFGSIDEESTEPAEAVPPANAPARPILKRK